MQKSEVPVGTTDDNALDEILMRHMTRPHRGTDFVVNFSYRLGIGEHFETWQAEEANWRKGTEAKVILFERKE